MIHWGEIYSSWEVHRLDRGRIRQQHSGQIFGFTSCLARFPQDDATIIVLSNLEETSIDDLIDRLTDILFEENKGWFRVSCYFDLIKFGTLSLNFILFHVCERK